MWLWALWQRWRAAWGRRLFSAGIVAVLTGHVVLYLLAHRESRESVGSAKWRQEAPLRGRIYRSGKGRGR